MEKQVLYMYFEQFKKKNNEIISPIHIISEFLCCDRGRRSSIVGLCHSDFFYLTEVSAYGPTVNRRQIVGRKGQIIKCTRTDFHSDFLSMIKNLSVYTGHNKYADISDLTNLSRVLLHLPVVLWFCRPLSFPCIASERPLPPEPACEL